MRKPVWVAVAIDGDGVVQFAGVAGTEEGAAAELTRQLQGGWSNLMKYEQDGPPYYGKFDNFVGEYDTQSCPAIYNEERS